MLEKRLQLAFDLYDACALAADIGTDHALLPAALLRAGRCGRMILTDISESALLRARGEMTRCRLLDRVSLRCGDGLAPIDAPCGMISILGMGGRTIAGILRRGAPQLQGAGLLLSAHTDLPLVRAAVADIGYHLAAEIPCRDRGRYYLFFLARPGAEPLTETEIALGKRLTESDSDALLPYLLHRREVHENKLQGLLKAETPPEEEIGRLRAQLSAEDRMILEVEEHERSGGI